MPCYCSTQWENEAVSYSDMGGSGRKSKLLQRKVLFAKNRSPWRDKWHPVDHQAGVYMLKGEEDDDYS